MLLKKNTGVILPMLMLVLWATGVFGQEDMPAYNTYEVLDVQELPLMAGPGSTGAHLSPDGTRFVHIEGIGTYCFYALDEHSTWAQTDCTTLDRSISGLDAEEIYWSPDSQWLSLPTYREAFLFFRDTDIRILNTETFEVVTLTEDDETGSPIDDGFNGFYDVSPQWRDDNTLLFLRYLPDDDSGQAHLMQVGVSDSDPQEVAVLPTNTRLGVYVLAVTRDGSQVAYNVNDFSSNPENGIWTIGLDDLDPEQLVAIEEQAGLPVNLAYSADNSYLLNLNARGIAYRTPDSGVEVVDLATGEIIPFDDSQVVIGAGWSPHGNALAYLVRNPQKPESSGLYISPAPGEPGRLVLAGEFAPPTSTWRIPLVWANNDTILLGRGAEEGVLLVQVGME